MKRLFGGKKQGQSGSNTPTTTPITNPAAPNNNASKSSTISTASSAHVGGEADQRFLAELAKILSEEEEAKKRELAEKKQQQQQQQQQQEQLEALPNDMQQEECENATSNNNNNIEGVASPPLTSQIEADSNDEAASLVSSTPIARGPDSDLVSKERSTENVEIAASVKHGEQSKSGQQQKQQQNCGADSIPISLDVLDANDGLVEAISHETEAAVQNAEANPANNSSPIDRSHKNKGNASAGDDSSGSILDKSTPTEMKPGEAVTTLDASESETATAPETESQPLSSQQEEPEPDADTRSMVPDENQPTSQTTTTAVPELESKPLPSPIESERDVDTASSVPDAKSTSLPTTITTTATQELESESSTAPIESELRSGSTSMIPDANDSTLPAPTTTPAPELDKLLPSQEESEPDKDAEDRSAIPDAEEITLPPTMTTNTPELESKPLTTPIESETDSEMTKTSALLDANNAGCGGEASAALQIHSEIASSTGDGVVSDTLSDMLRVSPSESYSNLSELSAAAADASIDDTARQKEDETAVQKSRDNVADQSMSDLLRVSPLESLGGLGESATTKKGATDSIHAPETEGKNSVDSTMEANTQQDLENLLDNLQHSDAPEVQTTMQHDDTKTGGTVNHNSVGHGETPDKLNSDAPVDDPAETGSDAQHTRQSDEAKINSSHSPGHGKTQKVGAPESGQPAVQNCENVGDLPSRNEEMLSSNPTDVIDRKEAFISSKLTEVEKDEGDSTAAESGALQTEQKSTTREAGPMNDVAECRKSVNIDLVDESVAGVVSSEELPEQKNQSGSIPSSLDQASPDDANDHGKDNVLEDISCLSTTQARPNDGREIDVGKDVVMESKTKDGSNPVQDSGQVKAVSPSEASSRCCDNEVSELEGVAESSGALEEQVTEATADSGMGEGSEQPGSPVSDHLVESDQPPHKDYANDAECDEKKLMEPTDAESEVACDHIEDHEGFTSASSETHTIKTSIPASGTEPGADFEIKQSQEVRGESQENEPSAGGENDALEPDIGKSSNGLNLLDERNTSDSEANGSYNPETPRQSVEHDYLFDDFADIKSSFQRLLSATSSTAATVSEATAPALSATAATVSEVTAPVLVEAGIIVSTSAAGLSDASIILASSASSMIDSCRREFEKRRSERRLIVSFVPEEPKMMHSDNSEKNALAKFDDETEDSAIRSLEQALSHDDVETGLVPSNLALSSGSDVEQYRNDVSHFLGETPNRDNGRGMHLSNRPHAIKGVRLEKKFEGEGQMFDDPVLRAAVAGAESRKRQIQQERLVNPPTNEWARSLKRLKEIAASTATTAVSISRPALQEARGLAAVIKASSNHTQQDEEEVVVMSQDVPHSSYAKRGTDQRVLSANSVSFERSPVERDGKPNVGLSSKVPRHPPAGHGISTSFSTVLSSIPHAVPIPDITTAKYRECPSVEDANDALNNPKRFVDFVSKKLLDHAANDPGVVSGHKQPKEYDATHSVFAHERIPSQSSSISSPMSPGALSHSSSDSGDESEQNSESTRSTTSKAAEQPPSSGVFWEMVYENDTSIVHPKNKEYVSVYDLDKPISAVSFDLNSPHINVPVDLAGGSEHVETESHQESAHDSESALPKMETHMEHPEESERSEVLRTMTKSTHDAALPLQTSDEDKDLDLEKRASAPFTEEIHSEHTEDREQSEVHGTNKPLLSETSNDSVLVTQEREQIVADNQSKGRQETNSPMRTPPPSLKLQDLDPSTWHSPDLASTASRINLPPPTTRKAPSVAKKRRQSDKRTEHYLVRSVKSAELDFDETDSISISGYISLPGAQTTGSSGQGLHHGGRRAREKVNSPHGSVNWTTNSTTGNSSFSASKRGSLYSAKKSSSRRRTVGSKRASRRLLLEDSFSQFTSMREIKSPETFQSPARHSLPSGIRHSLSESNLLLLPGDETESSIVFQAGSIADLDDVSGVEENAGILDLALMGFSSVANSNFFSGRDTQTLSEPIQYLASIRWRQLVSNWKHTELVKALSERPCSSHYRQNDEDQDSSDSDDDDEDSSGSTFAAKSKSGALDLLNFHRHGVIHPETKNLNGLIPHLADGEMTALTNFIVEFGTECGSKRSDTKLAHVMPESKKPVTVGTLSSMAASHVGRFAALMKDIILFASHNHGPSSDYREPEVSYSVGIKDLGAIEKKAQRKYNGDLLQVKDVLRAQIMFGDEGSLFAGILKLCKLCNRSDNKEKDGKDFQVEIVRVKNLFQKTPFGLLCTSTLPTGYRHILVNVRLNGQILAEIQFQLAEVFDVLGFEGYELHREILELEEALKHSALRTKQKPRGANDDAKDGKKAARVGKAGSAESQRTNENAKDSQKTTGNVTTDGTTSQRTRDDPKDSQEATTEHEEVANNSSSTMQRKEPLGEQATARQDGDKSAIDKTIVSDVTKNASSEASSQGTKSPADASTANGKAPAEKTPDTELSSAKSNTDATGPDAKESGTVDTVESDAGSINLFDSENRLDYLAQLQKTAGSEITREQVLVAMRAHAVDMARSNPRDVPTYFCLHLLVMLEIDRTTQDPEFCASISVDSNWPLACAKEADGGSDTLFTRRQTPLSARPSPQLLTQTGKGQNAQEEGEKGGESPSSSLKSNLQISKECLLRCLSIYNQGTSVGMTGWLEYGADSSFGRIVKGPFSALRELAYTCASSGDWDEAVDVLGALATRCDQHMPLYHPVTLCCLLDLAGAATKASRPSLTTKTMDKVATRLAFYLAEQENLFFSKYDMSSKEGTSNSVAVLRFENGIDGLSMLKAFVEEFQNQLGRGFPTLLVEDNDQTSKGRGGDMFLMNHCYLADAISVLANCVRASETLFGVSPDARNSSKYYWQAAYIHYETAFKGFLRSKISLSDDSVVSVAYGVARCLRELGYREKALQILSSLVSALGQQEAKLGSTRNYKQVHRHERDTERGIGDQNEEEPNSISLSFVPNLGVASRSLLLTQSNRRRGRREQSMALCLWLMAIFSVEEHPNERGRMRALSLLHAASEALQRVVTHPTEPPVSHRTGSSRAATKSTSLGWRPLSYQETCMELLLRIEREAKDLLEPLEVAAAEAALQPHGHPDADHNPSVMV